MSSTARPDPLRVRDLCDAAREVVGLVAGLERLDPAADRLRFLSVWKLVEIVGEAAKSVSAETRALAPSIPCREIAGTRDRLTHSYWQASPTILFEIATKDLPAILSDLDRLLLQLEPPSAETAGTSTVQA